MKHRDAQTPPIAPRLRFMVYLAALAVAFTVSESSPIDAHDHLEPPAVPDKLEVPAGHKVFLIGHALGTQNYFCVRSASGLLSWTFFGPQATLLDDHERQIITHFLSSNPDSDDKGALRPTWQHSRDTSTVWAEPKADFVVPHAIPWLLFEIVGTEPGPMGGQRLTRTTFIQRLNTSGGIAPTSTECAAADQKALVPYSAVYFFYKATKHEQGCTR